MAKSTCPIVVGSNFCYDHEIQLQMKEEWMYTFGGFPVKDIDGKTLFEVTKINHNATSCL